MGSNPSHFKGAKEPVENVSWDDCQSFLAKLNEKVSRKTFRLPTEAEWDVACRAGSVTDYSFGKGEASHYRTSTHGTSGTPAAQLILSARKKAQCLGTVQSWQRLGMVRRLVRRLCHR